MSEDALFVELRDGSIKTATIEAIKNLDRKVALLYMQQINAYYKIHRVQRGLHRDRQGNWRCGELHHIVGRAVGGTNDDSNLVVLNVAQHFYVHVLQAGAFPNKPVYKRMVAAFQMSGESRSSGVEPEEIESMRIEAALAMREAMKGICT